MLFRCQSQHFDNRPAALDAALDGAVHVWRERRAAVRRALEEEARSKGRQLELAAQAKQARRSSPS